MKKRLLLSILFFVFAVKLLEAQDITIKGTVLAEEDNQPLSDVTILVKGTNIGTITDEKGHFKLDVPVSATILVISYVGYELQEIQIAKNVKVYMKKEAALIDEVVVVAYGTQKKNALTGAVSALRSEEFEGRPLSNPIAALEGNISGVQMAGGSGKPGTVPDIRIRGFSSVNASNAPIYVVDGAIFNRSTGDLNVNDIESISILKDAASASLYGSSAGNGVVLITTKKAKKNGNTIHLNISQGFSSRAIREYKRVNLWEYYPLQWEMLKNHYYSYGYEGGDGMEAAEWATNTLVSSYLMYNPFKGVADTEVVGLDGKLNPNATTLLWGDDMDWLGAAERLGYRSEYNFSYGIKNDRSDTYVSFGYLKDDGYMKRATMNRYNARVNVNFYPVHWFSTGINIAANKVESNPGFSAGVGNPFGFSRFIGPIYPIYKHDPVTGEYLLDGSGNKQYDYDGIRGKGGLSRRHSLAEMTWSEYTNVRDAMDARLYMGLYLFNGLKFTVNASMESSNTNSSTYNNRYTSDSSPGGGLTKSAVRLYSYTVNEILSYQQRFGDHHLDIMLGHEAYALKNKYSNVTKNGEIMDGLHELSNFLTTGETNSYTDTYRKEGYFGRISYDYANRYYASFSYRHDGSSCFSRDTRWGNFMAFGLSWRIDQEPFMANVKWVDQLKLRASYGETGNDSGIGYYPYQTLYELGKNNSSEEGILFKSKGNEGLKWETQVTKDIALEFGFFDVVSGSVEVFFKQSQDLLFDVPQMVSSGITSVWENIGKVNNNGLEFDLNFKLIQTKDWNWSLGLNATTVKNKVKRFPEGVTEIIKDRKRIAVGRSIYDFWLKEYRGVDPADGAALYRFDREGGAVWSDEDCRTINGVEVTTKQAKAKYHYAGSAIPDWYGGINTSLSYRNWELSALFSYGIGGKVYDYSYMMLMSVGQYGRAMHADIKNRWQKPGDITDVPRLDGYYVTDFNAESDRWLVDADYFSMKSLTVGYALPMRWISKIGIKSAKMSVTGENLFVLNHRRGVNTQEAYTGNLSAGWLPARTCTFRLNVTF
ncbi:SusC/RagA family TonB-linked outer membrane protein [Odoribacter laneus]|jgi:tonB-linked outer membrane protein, susC/ragA family|uniref:SusC/RagA family TonB-linked outer membrane protein n=2 Tax=Odoribacter laneus TaxID=626933 RepID=UPI00189951C6|nr:TonB-dependent receptor [Odoribacter laneus]GKI22457.1 SusC/RagA family TonB-linked outer membrane protein [Odoribacter laneus]GKI24900.1 SusC/RagA family TonB-linked outer membrane protein [Odoribacter laneus]